MYQEQEIRISDPACEQRSLMGEVAALLVMEQPQRDPGYGDSEGSYFENKSITGSRPGYYPNRFSMHKYDDLQVVWAYLIQQPRTERLRALRGPQCTNSIGTRS